MWPDRAALVERLRALVADADRPGLRDETSTWAGRERERLDDRDVAGMDEVAWSVLLAMIGADAPTVDRKWLYGPEDFQAWLDELT